MEKSLTDLERIEAAICQTVTPAQAAAMNPLALAYLGDGLFSDAVRKYLLGCGHQNVNFMTKTSVKYVRASAQALAVHALIPELTEVEHRIVKRGRNTSSQVPKNAKASDYRYATGFEALLGYLHLCGDAARLEALILKSIAIINQQLAVKK